MHHPVVYAEKLLLWALEHADPPEGAARFHEIAHLGELAALIEDLN